MTAPLGLSIGKTLRYLGEAALFFPFMALFRAMGIGAASATGGFIGRHVFYRLPPAETARNNLKAAFPDKSPEEVEQIVRAVCENLGRVVGEYAHLDKMTLGPGLRIEIDGTEHAEKAIAAGKGVMFISGHLANWEVMPIAAAHLGYEGGLVYRPPNNPYVDRWISRQRGKLGPTEQITKSAQGTRRIFTLLRRGKCIFMLVDQKTYQGVPVPFFGRDAMTTSAPASLALKLGSTLLPASCERVNGAHFRMRIYPPIEFEAGGGSERDVLALTAKINATIEAIVRHRPNQWLWTHRRWTTPRDIIKMKAQGNGGAGVRVESEGSSLT
jgi:Kdo2-lipid IVA lauroyltransferase/acyltransferase